MGARTDPDATAIRTRQHWYEEFQLRPRFPRPPIEEITKLLKSIKEPQVFLRDGGKNVEIVIRLRSLSDTLLPNMKKEPITLARSFEDILWNKLRAGKNTIWAELARSAIEAYRQTWLQYFALTYVGHFHPQADKWLKELKVYLDLKTKATDRGRRSMTQAETASLERRFLALLDISKLIHHAAEEAVTAFGDSTKELPANELRKAIWERVRHSVHGMRGDGYIFDGAAFKAIPYGKNRAKLHQPKTWKPRQLAIALLSFERAQDYKTIEKKIKPTKSKKQKEPALTRI